MITRPTDAELKEFYLCGVRMGVARTEALRVAKKSTTVAAYDCVYCASWHYIPTEVSEKQLLDDAMTRYEAHVNEVLSHTSSYFTPVI